MNIKYRKSDGVVIAMGECGFVEDANHGVESVSVDIPHDDISNYLRIPGGIVRASQGVIDAKKSSENSGRRLLKQSARTALNMTKQQFKDFLVGLKAALEDGNDD